MAVMLSPNQVPDTIEAAYAAAYPERAERGSFAERAQQLDGDAIVGYVSGIKGKLFEQQYRDYLNAGQLPEAIDELSGGCGVLRRQRRRMVGELNSRNAVGSQGQVMSRSVRGIVYFFFEPVLQVPRRF